MHRASIPLLLALASCRSTCPTSTPEPSKCREEIHLAQDRGDVICPPGMAQHVAPLRAYEGHAYMLVSCDCPEADEPPRMPQKPAATGGQSL